MGFEEVRDFLYSMPKMGTDLERFRKALKNLGDPQEKFDAVNIVGTNGKGSVAAMVHSSMEADGLKAGLFMSPHLQTLLERIVVNRKLIGEKRFCSLFEEVKQAGNLSFFEHLTAMAYLYFADEGVDYAVVEAGVGGAHDPTSISKQKAVAITSVSMDHEDILGSTLREVAKEKAGIIKEGITAITLEQGEALEEIRKMRGKVIWPAPYFGKIGMEGPWQKDNAAIASALCRIIGVGGDAIEKGIASAKLHGRFERVGGIILDVAKNPAGWEKVSRHIDCYKEKDLAVVFACRKGKKVENIFMPKKAKEIIATEFPGPMECTPASEIADKLGCSAEPDMWKALEKALEHERVLVFGSFFLVGPISEKFYKIEETLY
ncbi:MAG: Mur ligase family protein [Candidatus Anstonellales archaeon]